MDELQPEETTPTAQIADLATGVSPHRAARRPPSVGRLAAMIALNLVIWLAANLITFVAVSFLVFVLLNLMGAAQDESAFTYALLFAIPSALTVSSYITGRRIIHILHTEYT